jgi:hypothetical protein
MVKRRAISWGRRASSSIPPCARRDAVEHAGGGARALFEDAAFVLRGKPPVKLHPRSHTAYRVQIVGGSPKPVAMDGARRTLS